MELPSNNTTAFDEVYQQVTEEIRELMKEMRLTATKYDNADTFQGEKWLDYLVESFRSQFLDWPQNEVKNLLIRLAFYKHARTKQIRTVPAIIRFSGHIFIHINYDLPRALAVTFTGETQGFTGKSQSPGIYRLPVVQPASELNAILLYSKIYKIFPRVMRSKEAYAALKDAGIKQRYFLKLLNHFRFTREIIDDLAVYVSGSRDRAWINATILSKLEESERIRICNDLLSAVEYEINRVLSQSHIFGIPVFRPVTTFTFAAVPTALLAQSTGQSTANVVLYSAIGVVSAALYISARKTIQRRRQIKGVIAEMILRITERMELETSRLIELYGYDGPRPSGFRR